MMTPLRQAITVPMVGIQVLVVDDAAPVRELLVNYFTRQKLAVTAVSDGSAAIQTLERFPGKFALVVTDLNMPGADGFAVLNEAKRSNPDCAVVIVTGYATLDSAIQAVRVGAYDFLPKPFNLSEVDRLLRRIATDRKWTDTRPTEPEAAMVPTSPVVPEDMTREQLVARVHELEARLASLGVAPVASSMDGIPTFY
jgi:DNA-binding NtrC family response regulator